MTSLNEALFTSVPTIAVLCNIFLLFTLFTAKKNAAIHAFMLLLGAFILWCGGSLFMRLQTAPGIEFWWKISLTGIFLVPYLYYLLAAAYTGRKGSFLKIIYGIATLAMIVLNFFDVFLCNAHMETAGDASTFHYDVTLWAIIPVIVSAVIIITMIVNLRASILKDDMHWKYLRPLIIGMVIMVAGVLLDVIPFMNTYPNDTLACLINAVFIYYAFCKKRIYSTSQIASEGAVFVLSLIITTVVFRTFGPSLDKFLVDTFSDSIEEPKVFLSTLAALLGILLFILLNKLLKNIFVKERARRDENVHNFSALVSSSLKLNEILARFYQLAKDETNAESIHISMFSRKHNRFEGVTDAENLAQPLTVGADNPLVEKLRKTKAGFFYEDFKRSVSFRSMWEEEKNLFDSVNANYVLPFMDDDRVIGFAVFSDKSGKKKYTYEDLKFLDSLSGVSAMAIKNARLYSQMETEARQDSLTNVYNRKALISEMEETLPNAANSPCTLILFNLDDFSLYNELYGTEEGDKALISFAGMISATVGNRGMVARYSGKEFAVLLPRCDSLSAKRIAEEVQKKLAFSIENSEDSTKKFLTFSAGICTYPYAATHMNQLVSYANMAVFNIKQKSKNDIAIFTANMQENNVDAADNIGELYSTIYALTAAIDAKDHYTFNHSQCVSKYAVHLAELAGLPADHVEIIRQAGLLHDIGKIGIPDAILSKEDRLTDDEFNIMRQHVERSIEMIRHLPSLDYVIPVVIGHHERYDGKGYPRGIKGEYIPVGARVLAIADAFDAMVSRRAYKTKMPVEKALEEIERNAGTQFDARLAMLFIEGVQTGAIQVIDY